MQKISPLRSSIEAFNKFKALRAGKNTNDEQKTQTNPFGIAFKGTVIQMDVFEKTNNGDNTTSTHGTIKEKLQNASKLLTSTWVGTINKFSSVKNNVIAFGNKIKDNTVATYKKVQEIANTPVELNPFKYSVSRLQTLSTGELRTMLANELQGA